MSELKKKKKLGHCKTWKGTDCCFFAVLRCVPELCCYIRHNYVSHTVLNLPPHPCLWALLSMHLSCLIMTPSPVSGEPVERSRCNGCVWSVPQTSQSFAVSVSTCFRLVAGIKFQISAYLRKSIKALICDNGLANDQILFYFTESQLLGIRVVV